MFIVTCNEYLGAQRKVRIEIFFASYFSGLQRTAVLSVNLTLLRL